MSNNIYGSMGDMQLAHIKVYPSIGEAYEVLFPVPVTDDLERMQEEIKSWIECTLSGVKTYKIVQESGTYPVVSANETRVDTSFGTLVARAGDETEFFPEVIVYLMRGDGMKQMLAIVSDLSHDGEDVVRIGVYGDPRGAEFTNRIVIPRSALLDDKATWRDFK